MLPHSQPVVTIPHGHYRDWYSVHEHCSSVSGQLGYVGLIRRYKGVDTLIRAFQSVQSLTFGWPASRRRRNSPTRSPPWPGDDPRITLQLKFLTDAEFVATVTSCELVVLPYRFMHNSGGTLAALSLDRPVLVPDNTVNRELGAEVGPGWVIPFEGELTGDHLTSAVAQVRACPDRPRPDLSSRDWSRAGADHANAYREAIALKRGRR